MRLFVAVWPPPSVAEVLAAMDRPVRSGVRWTAPAQWHVTLQFLGEVPDAEVDEVVASWGAAAAGMAPVDDVRLGERLEAFGPSVLYAPVEGLGTWAAAVVGTGPGRGPYVGHVTVARGDVRPLVGTAVPAGPRGWTAEAFTLVRSDLGPAGARYSTVADFPVGEHPHTNVRSQLR